MYFHYIYCLDCILSRPSTRVPASGEINFTILVKTFFSHHLKCWKHISNVYRLIRNNQIGLNFLTHLSNVLPTRWVADCRKFALKAGVRRMITYGIGVTRSTADRWSAIVVARNPGVAVALAVKINSKTVTRNLLYLFE